MDECGVCILLIVGAIVLYCFLSSQAEEQKREQQRQAEQKRIDDANTQRFNSLRHQFDFVLETALKSEVTNFYDLNKKLNDIYQQARKVSTSNTWRDYGSMEDTIKIVEKICEKMQQLPASILFSTDCYGQVKKPILDEIQSFSVEEVEQYISRYERLFETSALKDISDIDLSILAKYIWFYAMRKPYVAADLERAEKLFRNFVGVMNESLIAELYSTTQLGSNNVVRNKINNYLKYSSIKNVINGEEILMILASALMWMKAYDEEKMVLEFMLANGITMPQKLQERLHSLSNGGGKAPSGFEVESNDHALYFDISSLAWRDEEYTGLFENLAFKETDLTYSLAIRDENKNLVVSQGFNLADMEVILAKIQDVFAEEYGDIVVSKLVNGVALSGSGEEKIRGILSQTKECKQLGIFVHIARIGKKLNIKFYTLFMPTSGDVADQKQQALSMYKKLSPTVTMWEDGLKDTILVAIQQMLNDTTTSDSTTNSFQSSDEEVEF